MQFRAVYASGVSTVK